ncbi:MAG: S8/S53 family peptidase [Alphaproteobacteria bacterium]|nr:S8/S53 family peptidase [Alphaproteobacteria bacterium]
MAWNHDFVRLGEAIAHVGGGAPIDWGELRVAHLDTGYRRHPVLGPWTATPTGDASPIVLVEEGLNAFDAAKPPFDDGSGGGLKTPGHGCRTMSVLAGMPDPGSAFVGCAPGLPVVPYRVVDDIILDPAVFPEKNWRRMAKALRHAVDDAGCQFVSISLGGFGPTRDFGRAVDEAYEAGVIIVAAAGQIIDRVTYPGFYSRVFGVGGIRRDPKSGRISIYSEYDDHAQRVDVWAPAQPILRAEIAPNDTGATIRNGDGTSFAAPHVVAAAALWTLFHGAALDAYRGWRRVEAFWFCLKASQDHARMPPSGNHYANGVLDARALLDVPLPPPGQLSKNERPAEKERF